MSEPRYQTRVGDPDETTRIPREALDELRDADRAKEGTPPSGGPSTGSTPAQQQQPVDARSGGGGSSPTPRNGAGPSSGATPAVSAPDGRPSAFLAGANGSAPPAAGPSIGTNGAGPSSGVPGLNGSGAANGSGPSGAGPNGSPGGPNGSAPGGSGSAPGYRRSETGYSPASYPNPTSYGASQFSSLGEAPTTVTGPGTAGVGLGTGAAANTAAARSALGAATATRPPTARPAGGTARPSRRARLLVRHVDPWSTLKFSLVLAVAMFFVWLVAIGVLYSVLDGMGVFEQINGLYDEISGDGGDSLFSPGLVLGVAAIIGLVNIVLFTALATIGAFVYNICSDLVGGIEVTLAERD